MEQILYPLGALAVGWLLAWVLYSRFGEETSALEAVVKLGINTLWLLAAAVSAFTGFYTVAIIMTALWGAFAFNNYRTVREADVQTGSLRMRASNWTPSWVSDRRGRR